MNIAATCVRACAALLLTATTLSAGAASHRLTEDSYAQIRARYAGKPLVVHIWGMTCGPCLTELPKWGALRSARPDMNLVLIQADESPPAASEQTLREAGLSKAESWAPRTELDEYLRASIDPQWIGDMPRTLLVSPGGEVTRMRGVADLPAVRRWLESNVKGQK